MRIPKRRLRPGRAQRLRLFRYALTAASVVFVVFLLAGLDGHFRETGSWRTLWAREWRDGHVLTDLLGDGLFQFFVLVLGWSSYYRLSMNELAGLRLRRSEAK
ncbi:MAG: hypothetical protein R6X35_08650, partial [Candidatus Krumholzibacteriia bacterium]